MSEAKRECECREPDCFACELAGTREWLAAHGLHVVTAASPAAYNTELEQAHARLKVELIDARARIVRLEREGELLGDLYVADREIACTPAERAVLDAGNLVLDESLRRIADENGGCLADWARAELARRGAAK